MARPPEKSFSDFIFFGFPKKILELLEADAGGCEGETFVPWHPRYTLPSQNGLIVYNGSIPACDPVRTIVKESLNITNCIIIDMNSIFTRVYGGALPLIFVHSANF